VSSALGFPAARPFPAAEHAAVAQAERLFLRRLITYGFLVRAAVAMVLHFTGYSMTFAPDEDTYAWSGWQFASYWAGDLLVRPWRMASQEPLGYFYINGAFFYVFGYTELPIKIFNAFLGAFSGRYVYFIARDIFGEAAARRSAVLYEFFPSLILWSAVNIRDVWVIALIVFVSYKSGQVARGYSHLGVVQLLLAVYALTFFRDYLFYVVSVPPVAALVVGRSRNFGRNFALAVVAGIGIVLLLQHGAVSEKATSRMSLEAMSEARRDMATGGSAFHGTVDISTPDKALSFLPIGIAYFLFSPFPWEITSFLKMFSLPEMILFYALVPSIIRGVRSAVRDHFRDSFQILLLTALLTISYALGEGNVGTLYRHRAQVVTFYLMFGAVGLELRNQQRLREHRQGAPVRA
jgi:4-amino-4-deoxy-L-arabinose transferase-like glycosyltransferase